MLLNIAGILAFGTPAFVFISEMLISYSYPNQLPSNFFMKRVKFILLPFIFMGVFYAVLVDLKRPMEIPEGILLNVLGNYHGWFVLVIFQFYFLHFLIIKYGIRYNYKWVLLISFVVNVVYLAIFNFYKPQTDNNFILYYWESGYVKLFVGWLFYFTVAYYCGKNYRVFMNYLIKYKNVLYFSVPFFIGILILNNTYANMEFTSKRVDMIFLTLAIIFVLLINLRNVKKPLKFFNWIAKYSFGIYLVHYFFLNLINRALVFLNLEFGYLNILILFFGSLFGSIFVIYMLNRFPFGKYFVGRVNDTKKE